MLKLGPIGLVCFQLFHTGLQTLVPVSQSAHLLQSLYGLRVALGPNADPGQRAARRSAQSLVRRGLMCRRAIYTSWATCARPVILDRATQVQREDGYGVFSGGDCALQALGTQEGMSFTKAHFMPPEAEMNVFIFGLSFCL